MGRASFARSVLRPGRKSLLRAQTSQGAAVAFGDETNHFARRISCGWGPRAESAVDVARRLQRMARDLRRVEPDLGSLWPAFSSRAIRPSDAGPVDQLPIEDLARLIDSRARFDPPHPPAPVGPSGYDLTLAELPTVDWRWRLDPHLIAGSVELESRNGCHFRPDVGFPAWNDRDKGRALLCVLIAAWKPAWATANASLKKPNDDQDGRVTWPRRPWLIWVKSGETIPYEFMDIGEPTIVRAEHGGELRIWP